MLEVELSLDELAKMLADQLELPNIQPKGQETISEEKANYNSIRRVGPESLRHFKRTYIEALRRQISDRHLQPVDPRVVPYREDRRYRSWEYVPEPQANAVMVYMMDVSGSMTDEQKEIVRTEVVLDRYLAQEPLQAVHRRYIIHDAAAKEVDENTFYRTRESGGTRISSAYKVCAELLDKHFDAAELEHLLLPVLRRRQLGRRQPAVAAACCASKSCPSAICSATGRSKAPTAAASIIRALESAFGKEHENTGAFARSRTRKAFTTRSRSFWEREVSLRQAS